MILSLLLLAADPCVGVVDRTAECTAPDEEAAVAAADPKGAAPAIPGGDALRVPQSLGFVAGGLAVLGGAALAFSFSSAPEDARQGLRDGARVGGVAALAGAALVGAAAAALAVFDPAAGTMRTPLEGS
jgi:hypothetical protein